MEVDWDAIHNQRCTHCRLLATNGAMYMLTGYKKGTWPYVQRLEFFCSDRCARSRRRALIRGSADPPVDCLALGVISRWEMRRRALCYYGRLVCQPAHWFYRVWQDKAHELPHYYIAFCGPTCRQVWMNEKQDERPDLVPPVFLEEINEMEFMKAPASLQKREYLE